MLPRSMVDDHIGAALGYAEAFSKSGQRDSTGIPESSHFTDICFSQGRSLSPRRWFWLCPIDLAGASLRAEFCGPLFQAGIFNEEWGTAILAGQLGSADASPDGPVSMALDNMRFMFWHLQRCYPCDSLTATGAESLDIHPLESCGVCFSALLTDVPPGTGASGRQLNHERIVSDSSFICSPDVTGVAGWDKIARSIILLVAVQMIPQDTVEEFCSNGPSEHHSTPMTRMTPWPDLLIQNGSMCRNKTRWGGQGVADDSLPYVTVHGDSIA